jgi:DNA-binding response OmpR family regulator
MMEHTPPAGTDAAADAVSVRAAKPRSVAKPKLLIVEDDARACTSLATLFGHLGFETACAGSVAEAEQMLRWNPGFVLLDLMLPDGSGKDILEKIRQTHLPIRVAVTTGADDSMLLSEVSDLQPDAMYRKPLDLDKVSRWLTRGA